MALGWLHNVPSAGQVLVAPGTSPTSWYTTPENVQHIAYVGTDQRIHELFFVGPNGQWLHSVPGAVSDVLVAPGTSPTSWYTTPENVQHIAYVGTDGLIHECFFFRSGPEWFVVDAPSITFGTGIAVGGYGRLTVFSDGTTHFQGHLHDSGFVSYDCLAVFTVKDADGRAYAASRSGRVRGTLEPGSRDLDWDDWGTNDAIRENWPKIRSGGHGHYKVDVTSDWTPQKITEFVIAVAGLVLAIIPLVASGGSSNKSSDPDYGRPEAYPPGGLPPPETSVGGA